MNSISIESVSLASRPELRAPHSTGYRIKLLSQLLYRKFSDRLEPFGLTPFHWLVLCCLWQEDGLPTSGIGEKLQQVGGTLTGVLDRMEERGFVRRAKDPVDRRICRIWLTDSGKDLEDILPQVVADLHAQTWAGVPAQAQAQFSQSLNQAIANLS
ncbi:MAG: MarR family transcriptional regulator [Chamaesiphon sp.]|nr:MarR family transcriptional regulator [Chamaesiphon sp.]